jgi:hypothetical protein
MKAMLLILSMCASAAMAMPLNLGQNINSAVQKQGPDASVEFNRLQHLASAQTLGEAMDYMTPEELAKEFNLPEDDGAQVQTVSDPIVVIDVNISSKVQRLTVVSPEGQHTYKISSARPGYHTKLYWGPPKILEKMHYSHKYHNSPMPHSMFYYGGYAIHGTYETKHLGRPASHGCVRVHPDVAAYLYGLVQKYGKGNTLISIHY